MRHRRRSSQAAAGESAKLPARRFPARTGSRHWREALSLHAENSAAAAKPADRVVAPLATLLTQHILRNGELIILVLRPSLWFIPLICIRFIAAVLIVMIAAHIFSDQMSARAAATILEFGILVMIARLMFAVLQWSGQLYVLTEMRILKLSGIFSPDIYDCPLRKIARVRLIRVMRERVAGVGSIEIIPCDEHVPIGLWQSVARPREIHRIILSTIARAKQGSGWGSGSGDL